MLFGKRGPLSGGVQDMQQMAPEKPKKRGLLGGIDGGKLIALGGALQGDTRAIPAFLAQQQALQQQAAQFAQQRRLKSLEDARWYEREQFKIANREPRQPYRFEDNAGNVWSHDQATGQNTRIFTDSAPKIYFQDGAMVRVPNPYTSSQQSGGYAEGTVIENDAGKRMILRNGQWVDM